MVNIVVQPSPSSPPIALPTSTAKPDDLSSTTGGSHFLSSTPGGTRLWYTREQLLALQGPSPPPARPAPPPSSARPPLPARLEPDASGPGALVVLPDEAHAQAQMQPFAPGGAAAAAAALGLPTVPGSGIGIGTGVSSVGATPSGSPNVLPVASGDAEFTSPEHGKDEPFELEL